ncbi:MAG TPA: hypothetical protein VLM37_07285 [Fibrobacteraceae bacterium]|nr:hypothetical protein [Fibrobacteraceae bacterium]
MPTFGEHGAHSRHNLAFLDTFFLSQSNDWAVTVMFYTAVHIVESILGKDHDIHCRKHQERSAYLEKLSGFPCNAYKLLERNAHDSRYKGYKVFDWEVHLWFKERFIPLVVWYNAQVQTKHPKFVLDLTGCKEKDAAWFQRYLAKDPECNRWR